MTQPATPVLDLLHPDFIRDPYPMVARMLREQPIAFDARMGGWLVGRYADVMALSRDPRLSNHRVGVVTATLSDELREQAAPLVAFYEKWMVMADPPRHTRLRKLAGYAFKPSTIAGLEGFIAATVDELLDAAMSEGEEMEFRSQFADPLPQKVISKMVGVPEEDRSKFVKWTLDLLELLTVGLVTGEALAEAQRSYEEVTAYFAELIEARKQAPVEGEILSELLAASDGEDQLTAEEVTTFSVNLMAGGFETTTHLLSNAMLCLLQHPEQLELLREDPSLIPSAVEEVLRYEPSITFNARLVTEAIEHGGHRFEPGQLVYFLSCAANRDPERFPEPDRFDARRGDNKHVTFGFGIHFCLGAPLARMEAKIALERILERMPGLRLPEQELERAPNMAMRPLTALRLSW